MASVFVIPIILVIVLGLSGYLVYRFLVFDLLCRRKVSRTLRRYDIKKTPAEIIREYHRLRGESISDARVRAMERDYRQRDPDQFLAMYDKIRESR